MEFLAWRSVSTRLVCTCASSFDGLLHRLFAIVRLPKVGKTSLPDSAIESAISPIVLCKISNFIVQPGNLVGKVSFKSRYPNTHFHCGRMSRGLIKASSHILGNTISMVKTFTFRSSAFIHAFACILAGMPPSFAFSNSETLVNIDQFCSSSVFRTYASSVHL